MDDRKNDSHGNGLMKTGFKPNNGYTSYRFYCHRVGAGNWEASGYKGHCLRVWWSSQRLKILLDVHDQPFFHGKHDHMVIFFKYGVMMNFDDLLVTDKGA